MLLAEIGVGLVQYVRIWFKICFGSNLKIKNQQSVIKNIKIINYY